MKITKEIIEEFEQKRQKLLESKQAHEVLVAQFHAEMKKQFGLTDGEPVSVLDFVRLLFEAKNNA